MKISRSEFLVQVAPPPGLGFRRTNVSHKSHALIQQLLVMSGLRAKDFVHRIVALTTDFGVESGLTHQQLHMEQICPYACQVQFTEEDAASSSRAMRMS